MQKQMKNEKIPLFGQKQLISAVILLFVGILLAFMLLVLSNGDSSLAEVISNSIDLKSNQSWLDIGLWVVELACYFIVAYSLLPKKVLYSFGGMVLGILLRLFITFLMALLLHSFAGETLPSMFVAMDNELWIMRLPAIITAVALLAFPARRLLESGFGWESHLLHKSAPESRAKSFNFNNTRHEVAGNQVAGNRPVTEANTTTSMRGEKKFAPPEGFSPIAPLAGVNGTVNISHNTILASVPEAQPYLLKDYPIRVRKAYIVPQLRRGTVWLTWQQVFPGGADDLNYIHADRPDAQFQGRWIRIPAKEYVMQLDMEFFAVKTPVPPGWMQRPEVPQEAQFDVVSNKVR